MFICRLFHRHRPFEQIEARLLAEGQLTLGRDPSADWVLPDTDRSLSRIHCRLALEAGRLYLYDTSTNGVFLDDGSRATTDAPVELSHRQSARLGDFIVLVDGPHESADLEDSGTTIQGPSPLPDWSDAMPQRPPHRDASLIEAFCEGAKLDPSALSSEDPHELMRRAGFIYQQMMLGLSVLMAERTRWKGEHELERTTIRAAANNPFKWTASRRLAQELLCGPRSGFLGDGEAVRASFQDLAHHMAALADGADAAAKLALKTLSPEAIEAEARGQASLLRSRQTVCWEIHNRRHAALAGKSASQDEALKRAVTDAYAQSASAASS